MSEETTTKFQFHRGSIKSFSSCGATDGEFISFNSTVVRLSLKVILDAL